MHALIRMCDPLRSQGPGELYVVYLRHCKSTNMPVYKVGRAEDAGERLKAYAKGSIILARIPVSNMLDSEAVLLRLCRDRFIERRDFGAEYFEGNLSTIISTLIIAADLFPHVLQDAAHTHDTAQPVEPITTHTDPCVLQDAQHTHGTARPVAHRDPCVMLLEYVHENMETLLDGPVDTVDLFQKLTQRYVQAGCKHTPSLKSMLKDLKRHVGCTEIFSHAFPDARIRHATVFHRPNTVRDNTHAADPEPPPRPFNPIAEWLDGRVSITGVQTDCISLHDLRKAHAGHLTHRHFLLHVKAHLHEQGVSFRDHATIASGSGHDMLVSGVAMRPILPALNVLKQFLAMEDDTRRCTIERVVGEITLELDFKAAFDAAFQSVGRGCNDAKPRYEADAAVFSAAGFRLAHKEHMCKSCNRVARGHPNQCCDLYNNRNRVQKTRIHDMRLTRVTVMDCD